MNDYEPSVSDVGVGRGGHRISRSEDIGGGGLMTANNAGFAQSHLQQSQPQPQPQSSYGHHQNSLSVGGGFEFHSQQYLHPNNQLGAAGASASRWSLPPTAGGGSSSLANPNANVSQECWWKNPWLCVLYIPLVCPTYDDFMLLRPFASISRVSSGPSLTFV